MQENSATPELPEPVPAAPAAPEGPKLNCDITISVREGVLQPLKVNSMGELTYNQIKEVVTAGGTLVDQEFTERCKELQAMVYSPKK